MASRNSRTNRKEARSSRAPQSARAVRSAKAAQSGRIAPYSQASAFSRDAYGDGSSYRAAYTPGSQGSGANGAYARQTAASQYSRNNPSYSAARKKAGRGKKIALGVIIAILVVAVGGGSAFALWKNSVNEKLIKGNKSDEEIMAINDALKPEKDMTFTEPFYMILIGTDEAEDSTEDMHRSDTNIVVRIDPAKNQATMVSIPRDTKIDIDGYGTNKFNAAYAYGGAAGTIREANQLLGIEISHYAEVNFGKLKELVDAVGGVDVEVTERVDDPDADGTTAHPEWPRVIIEEGEQHLDGNQALVFARSRAYPDGDFTRTANQRKLIMAIVNKVLALNTAELLGAVQAAANCVTTDLAVGHIAALAQQFQDDGDLTIYSAMVPSTTAMIGDVSYVINDPVATKEMMKLVEAGEDPSSVVSSGYVDPGDTTGGASTYGNGYGSTGSGAGNGAGNTNYYDPGYTDASGTGGANNGGYVDNGYVDNTGGAGGTGGYDNGAIAGGAGGTDGAGGYDPGYTGRLRRDGIRCLAGVSLGFSNCASGIGFDRCRFLIGSSTGRLSFGSPVEFSYPLRDTGDHRLQRRMGLAKT